VSGQHEFIACDGIVRAKKLKPSTTSRKRLNTSPAPSKCIGFHVWALLRPALSSGGAFCIARNARIRALFEDKAATGGAEEVGVPGVDRVASLSSSGLI
jgi:hypothetical protein